MSPEQLKQRSQSGRVSDAVVGGLFVVAAAVITGIFTLIAARGSRDPASGEGHGPASQPPPISSLAPGPQASHQERTVPTGEGSRQLREPPRMAAPPKAASISRETVESARPASFPDQGIWIIGVDRGSEADLAGFRVGQVLVRLNGTVINYAPTANAVIRSNIGYPITAIVWGSGTEYTLKVTPDDHLVGLDLCQFDRCPDGRKP